MNNYRIVWYVKKGKGGKTCIRKERNIETNDEKEVIKQYTKIKGRKNIVVSPFIELITPMFILPSGKLGGCCQ